MARLLQENGYGILLETGVDYLLVERNDYIASITDSIMNAVGRFTLLKGVPSAIHTIWNILNRPITPTSWNGITKSATTWITKITGQ